ncbi:MAG: arginine--tRNA ligase [Deinococcales bacterium]
MLKDDLKNALADALRKMAVDQELSQQIAIQDVPEGRSGDFGSPIAFTLAKALKKNPAAIAQEIVNLMELPQGIAKVEAIGPYINFHVEVSHYIEQLISRSFSLPSQGKKAIVEHTSINPNKEAHVGHLRNIALGDACARILRAAGYEVEVQNYIDDTGRQAAESLFAVDYFKARYDGSKKYDHWLGELYVRLGQAKSEDGERIEAGVREVMHHLEAGELREDIARIVHSLLETSYALGVEYDLLVWESDVVKSGFLGQGLAVLKQSDSVSQPSEGKYAGALVMDVSSFIPGLEEPNVVLMRSDGNAMYVAKDIGYHFWKLGLFKGLKFAAFATQPSGHVLYSSSPEGEEMPEGKHFSGGKLAVNVIDVRQSHPQLIVKTALKLSDAADESEKLHHLAYEVVTLEGQAMSGRKGITLAIDTVIEEAIRRAKAIVTEKNPDLAEADVVAKQVGIGALRFGMLKSEAKKVIDFRWEQALSLQGDSAPYVQYAHARAASILRAAKEQGIEIRGADFGSLGGLELKLAKTIAHLPDIIQAAARDFAPHVLAQYALDLATAWNSYYNHKDEQGKSDTQVLRAEAGLREARLALVAKVKEALAYSLNTLGISAPEAM